jgi:hypothetical protein
MGAEVTSAASDRGIPPFWLIAGMVFAILAILMMMLTGAFQYKSKGFWVHLLKPGAAPAKPDAWTEPVIVLVKDAWPGSRTRTIHKLKGRCLG